MLLDVSKASIYFPSGGQLTHSIVMVGYYEPQWGGEVYLFQEPGWDPIQSQSFTPRNLQDWEIRFAWTIEVAH